MKKQMKRFLATLLALSMLWSMSSVGVLAAVPMMGHDHVAEEVPVTDQAPAPAARPAVSRPVSNQTKEVAQEAATLMAETKTGGTWTASAESSITTLDIGGYTVTFSCAVSAKTVKGVTYLAGDNKKKPTVSVDLAKGDQISIEWAGLNSGSTGYENGTAVLACGTVNVNESMSNKTPPAAPIALTADAAGTCTLKDTSKYLGVHSITITPAAGGDQPVDPTPTPTVEPSPSPTTEPVPATCTCSADAPHAWDGKTLEIDLKTTGLNHWVTPPASTLTLADTRLLLVHDDITANNWAVQSPSGVVTAGRDNKMDSRMKFKLDTDVTAWTDTVVTLTTTEGEQTATIHVVTPSTPEPHVHTYGEPGWTWNDAKTEATATFTCSSCDANTEGHTKTLTATGNAIETVPVTPATCYSLATVKYKATVQDGEKTYTNTTTDAFPVGEFAAHVYGEPEWVWSVTDSPARAAANVTATATLTCENCMEGVEGHTKTLTATGDAITTNTVSEATCTAPAKVTYTAKVDGYEATSGEYTVGTALGHTYGEPTWTWAEDKSTATATFVCACGDEQTVTAAGEAVTVAVTQEQATCDQAELSAATAKVTFSGAEYTDTTDPYQTKAPKAHVYGDSCENNGDGTHSKLCVNCGAKSTQKIAHTFVDGVCVCGVGATPAPDVSGAKFAVTVSSDLKNGDATYVYGTVDANYNAKLVLPDATVNAGNVTIKVDMNDVASLGGGNKSHQITLNTGSASEGNLWNALNGLGATALANFASSTINATVVSDGAEKSVTYTLMGSAFDMSGAEGTRGAKEITGTPNSTEAARAAWQLMVSDKNFAITNQAADDSYVTVVNGSWLQIGKEKLVFETEGDLTVGKGALSVEDIKAAVKVENAESSALAFTLKKGTTLAVGQSVATLTKDVNVTVDGVNADISMRRWLRSPGRTL